MLVATQMRRFFTDLNDAAVETSLALVHSRYSTNTTPSWERAHPNRYIIHNGEINTLRGNISWTRAREPKLYSPVLGEDLKKILPIINREGSDSAILDNVLEFLTMNGRPLDRAVTMMIPEPWDNNDRIEKRRAYDAYQSMLMEPWDGPAAIAFTDGRMLGAALDRNGLRPARYYVTRKDWLILSSEVGTIDVDPEDILQAGCLGPGEMLEVDPDQGRVIWNDEIRNRYANEKPYRDWLGEEMLSVDDLPLPEPADPAAEEDAVVPFTRRMAKLGYHFDDIQELIRPMANKGSIPLASMGTDAPLACLSKKTRSFFDYFNQLFAQVTNPPIDALRESFVTSTVLYVGNHGNLLEDCRDTCRLVRLEGPMLTHDEFDRLCSIDRVGFKTARFSCTYPRSAAEISPAWWAIPLRASTRTWRTSASAICASAASSTWTATPLSRTTTRRSPRASRPSCRRWASPRCRVTIPRRSSRSWDSTTHSSTSASPTRPRASADLAWKACSAS